MRNKYVNDFERRKRRKIVDKEELGEVKGKKGRYRIEERWCRDLRV